MEEVIGIIASAFVGGVVATTIYSRNKNRNIINTAGECGFQGISADIVLSYAGIYTNNNMNFKHHVGSNDYMLGITGSRFIKVGEDQYIRPFAGSEESRRIYCESEAKSPYVNIMAFKEQFSYTMGDAFKFYDYANTTVDSMPSVDKNVGEEEQKLMSKYEAYMEVRPWKDFIL